MTGAVVRVFMLSWDRKFLNRVENMTLDFDWKMYMYMRYVDDCNCIGEEIPPGTRVDNDRLVIKPEHVDQDKAEPGDKRTATFMHMAAISNPNRHQSNAFGKHITEVHDEDTEVQFKVDVIRSYNKPLERQVREGVEIYNIDADIIMNSKIDYFQPRLRRLGFNNLFED